jgi:pyrimidine deaminase RibD-like protein
MNVVARTETGDESFMRRALLASQKALPACLPNPPVGCILVREGAVLSEGYTHAPGQFHAEAHAVSQIDSRLDGVTAFVTLEPCSFRGRTASCALMLVERGVSRVVVSLLDPDPRNNGKGISILRSAGIAVTIGILESEVRNFIGLYLDLPANKFPSCSCPDHTRG